MFKNLSIKKFVLLIISAVMIFGIFISAAVMYQNSIKGQAPEGDSPKGDILVSTIENSPALLMSAVTHEDGYVTLTATVMPENATDKSLSWSVEFVNPSSAWASGKDAEDYVSVSESPDTLTANVFVHEGFSEKIKITARSNSNTSVKASCVCDYYERIENFELSGEAYNFEASIAYYTFMDQNYYQYNYSYHPLYTSASAFTLEAEIESTNYIVKVSEELYNALESYGISNSIDNNSAVGLTDRFIIETLASGIFTYDTSNNITGFDETVYSKLKHALLSCHGEYDIEIIVAVSTAYETVEKTFKLKFDRSSIQIPAESVTFNNSTLIL